MVDYSRLFFPGEGVDGASFHFYVFFDFVLLVFVVVVLVGGKFVLEELAISEGGKLLTQLHVFVLAILVTPLVETRILVRKSAVDVFGLQHRRRLSRLRVPLVFAHLQLRSVSVACRELGVPPGVHLILGQLLTLLRHHVVALEVGPRLGRNFLGLGQLLLLFGLVHALGVVVVGVVGGNIVLSDLIRRAFLLLAVPSDGLGAVGVGQKVLLLLTRTKSHIMLPDLLLCFHTLVLLQPRQVGPSFCLGLARRLLDRMLRSFRCVFLVVVRLERNEM